MQKKLIALAIAGLASSGVMAQSNVTVYGNIDLAVVNASGTSSAVQAGGTSGAVQTGVGINADAVAPVTRGSVTTMDSGTRSTSRVGFKGTENLGSGLKASFVVETTVAADGATGQAAPAGNFFADREASLALEGSLGAIKLGRQATKAIDSFGDFDATGDSGPGSIGYLLPVTVSSSRANNSVKYETPNLGGFVGSYQFSMSENQDKVAAATSGSQSSMTLVYAAGPVAIQGSHFIARDYALTESTYKLPLATKVATAQLGKTLTIAHLGGSYDFGVAKLMGQHVTVRNTQMAGETARTIDATTSNLGVTVPLNAHLFRVNYVKTNDKRANNQDATSWGLGYDYSLSKRTTMYAGAAKVSNTNGAQFSANTGTANALSGVAASQTSAADGRTNAYYAGVNHTF